MIRLRLSPAQVSALECRDGGGLDPLTLAAWRGSFLVFERAEAEALADELNEASNAEDAQAEFYGCRFARRAARSFYAMTSRVLKAARG